MRGLDLPTPASAVWAAARTLILAQYRPIEVDDETLSATFESQKRILRENRTYALVVESNEELSCVVKLIVSGQHDLARGSGELQYRLSNQMAGEKFFRELQDQVATRPPGSFDY
jgi:hypothetical protein